MLTACAASRTETTSASVAAPVVETRTEVRLYCPAELDAPVAAFPAVSDDAVLEGNDAGLSWLTNVIAFGRGLADRLSDARKACP